MSDSDEEKLLEILLNLQFENFVGVPDSVLSSFTNEIEKNNRVRQNIIASNEGQALSIAAGFNIVEEFRTIVYLQNSGIGNMINPLVSLNNKSVYDIPQIFVIGWRGEPGIKDEPQHIFQGEITLGLLDILGIKYFRLNKESLINGSLASFIIKNIEERNSAAIMVPRNFLKKYEIRIESKNLTNLNSMEAYKTIINSFEPKSVFFTSTGYISRDFIQCQLIEDKELQVFPNVGAMGHVSSIALGYSLSQPNRKVVIIDGDGALLMQMGAIATIGSLQNENLIHILMANGIHESVGGQSISNKRITYLDLFRSVGYKDIDLVSDSNGIKNFINKPKVSGPRALIIEINKSNFEISARNNTDLREFKKKLIKEEL